MVEKLHLSLEAKLTSLYAPELRFTAIAPSLLEKEIRIRGTIGGQPISIIQATGCSPTKSENLLKINNVEFSFILAWEDLVKEAAPYTGLKGLRSFFAGIFPFDSKIIELEFSGDNFPLTTSFHIELPHYITRYYNDTVNLQHVFSESGMRAPSYMGGICEDGEKFQMHLHYKSLDAFRRIANPAITMISVIYLDLAAILTGGADWRNKPAVIFGVLCINATAFGNLAAIRVGSTTRSLLNVARLVAVLWVLLLTLTIRGGGLPGIEHVVDLGIKGCIVWLMITAYFSFMTYAAERNMKVREKRFLWLSIIGLFIWMALYFFLEPFSTAVLYSKTINN